MEHPPVEAILFDLGGTLRRTTKRDEQGKRERIQHIRQSLGSDLPLDQFARILSDRYQAYRRWAEDTMNELDEEHLWMQWMASDYPPERVRQLAPSLNRIWRDATGIRDVYPETIPVVQELHRRGYSLGVVSNTISRTEVPLALKDSDLSRYFKAVVLSSVFGRRKPDPSMLLAAAKKLGVSPSYCAYIGNRLDRDVVGARRAGFATVLIVHHGHGAGPHSLDPALMPDRIIHNLREILNYFPARE
jgi:putative hydrolase of the HAD superfamily